MGDLAWLDQRLQAIASEALAITIRATRANQRAMFDKAELKLGYDRKDRKIRGSYYIDGDHYCDTVSYSPACKEDRHIAKALAITDMAEHLRSFHNALMIEANLHRYLGQWLSDQQVLSIMSDIHRESKQKTGPAGHKVQTYPEVMRTIEIIDPKTMKVITAIRMQVVKGCLYGEWRLSPQAKWRKYSIVVQGTFPATILDAMGTSSNIIDHPLLNPDLAVTRAKTSNKTTTFDIAVNYVTRNEMLQKISACPGNGPYIIRPV